VRDDHTALTGDARGDATWARGDACGFETEPTPANVDAVEHLAFVAFYVQRKEVDVPDAQPPQLVAYPDAPQALGDRRSLFV
tara:strand:+ start:588 stop:833 length:246 start_codon:yes stop_codon:yes gene_type:complete